MPAFFSRENRGLGFHPAFFFSKVDPKFWPCGTIWFFLPEGHVPPRCQTFTECLSNEGEQVRMCFLCLILVNFLAVLAAKGGVKRNLRKTHGRMLPEQQQQTDRKQETCSKKKYLGKNYSKSSVCLVRSVTIAEFRWIAGKGATNFLNKNSKKKGLGRAKNRRETEENKRLFSLSLSSSSAIEIFISRLTKSEGSRGEKGRSMEQAWKEC